MNNRSSCFSTSEMNFGPDPTLTCWDYFEHFLSMEHLDAENRDRVQQKYKDKLSEGTGAIFKENVRKKGQVFKVLPENNWT